MESPVRQVHNLCILSDPIYLTLLESEFPIQGALHILQAGEPDESVARSDVEVDIRKRLQVLDPVYLGHKLEEEAQLADLHSLFHDVHAVEVVDDDGFQDVVATVRMLVDLCEDSSKITELLRPMLLSRMFQVF
jgi:hypothetical protein